MVCSFFEYLPSFQRYSKFCSKIDDVTNCISTKINHKIKNISENIVVMLLKLKTENDTYCMATVLLSGPFYA